MENDNTYYKYKTFKSTIHTELLSHLSPVILPHGHYDETIGWKITALFASFYGVKWRKLHGDLSQKAE